jgi:hypothetical protein
MSEQTDLSLSLNDLKLCLQIIDICSTRGAFKAEEFQAVGAIHTKLKTFIEHATAASSTAEVPESTEETSND